MNPNYYMVSRTAFSSQRKESNIAQSNIHFRSRIQTNRASPYGFNHYDLDNKIKSYANINNYSPLQLHSYRGINKQLISNQTNPFLKTNPIRYYQRQTNNSSSKITSWQKYKYLNKLRQNQEQIGSSQFHQIRKTQQRHPIIRAPNTNYQQKEQTDFNKIKVNDLIIAKHDDFSKLVNKQITDLSYLGQNGMDYSITKKVNVSQYFTNRQIGNKIEQNNKQAKEVKSLPIISQYHPIHKEQSPSIEFKAKTEFKSQSSSSQNKIQPIIMNRFQTKVKKTSSLLFTQKNNLSSKDYPKNIIYNNTAYQFIPLT